MRLAADAKGLGAANLGADVDADSGGLDPFVTCGITIYGARAADVDAELVLAQAGRDVGVGLGEDVRIDSQGDGARFLSFAVRSARSSSSPSLSTLKSRMPERNARSISGAVLPTPEKTTRARGGLCLW